MTWWQAVKIVWHRPANPTHGDVMLILFTQLALLIAVASLLWDSS